MRKTDKKHERLISEALTTVCHKALSECPGFVWITHFVDYRDFPRSLIIVSVFETDEALGNTLKTQSQANLSGWIREALRNLSPPLSISDHQIQFDSEEACNRESGGNWQRRYQSVRRH